MALPRRLDRECGFRLAREILAERTQLGDAAQHALDEVAVDHRIEPKRKLGVVPDELVGDRAAESIAPAFLVETQQMVAIKAGAVDPELADHAFSQGLVHWDSER